MKELSREAKRVIRKADQALETGAITYSRHRTIVENVRKGRPASPLSQKEVESQRPKDQAGGSAGLPVRAV